MNPFLHLAISVSFLAALDTPTDPYNDGFPLDEDANFPLLSAMADVLSKSGPTLIIPKEINRTKITYLCASLFYFSLGSWELRMMDWAAMTDAFWGLLSHEVFCCDGDDNNKVLVRHVNAKTRRVRVLIYLVFGFWNEKKGMVK